MQAKCSATTKADAPCRAPAMPGSTLCVTHDPAWVTDLAEWRRTGAGGRGGRERVDRVSTRQTTRLEKLELVWRRPRATCAGWPPVVCVDRPDDPDDPGPGAPRGACPASGATRPELIGVDRDLL